jgi:amino acid adenylation domain-containing protein
MPNDIIEGFELSPQQKRLWLLPQNNLAYRAQLAISIDGELKVEVLKEALHNLINRHEILHTTFHSVPGLKLPIQSINDSPNIQWQEIDLRSLGFERQQARGEELFREEGQYSFDLEQGSVVRLTLLTLSAHKYTLLLTLPALCADARTLRNIVQEISSFYAARSGQKESDELPTQYVQFSAWQNEILEEEYTETGTGYWRGNKISNFLNLKLPFEAQSVEKLEFQPQLLALTLCPDTVARIKAFVQEHEISTSLFFLTCWKILLWRLTRQPDIVIGTLCDGRSYEGLEEALGLFAKYLPVHCHLEDDDPFIKALQQVDESTREAYAGQEYFAWEQIVGESENFDAPSLSLFCFNFEQQPAKYSADDVSFAIYKQYAFFDRFKVKLSCIDRGGVITTEFYYDSSLFSAATIERLAGQFNTLLQSVISNSDVSISELQILSAAERHQLLVEWNNTQIDYPKNQCIHQLFEAQVERTPDAIAVVFEDEQLTYWELNARANQLAHYLQVLGVEPEVPVGLHLERSIEMVVGLLGILKAGGAYVPLDPAYPQERLAFMLADTQISVLLTQQKLVEGLPENGLHVVCLDKDWTVINCKSPENMASGVTADNLAYIIYTSGSTGKPKGIGLAHRPLINLLEWHNSVLCTGAHTLQFASLSFDASFHEIFATWVSGGTLFIVSEPLRVNAISLGRFLSDQAIEKAILPVVVLQQLAEFVGEPGVAPLHAGMFSNLREITTTGEQLRITKPIVKFFKALEHCSLHNHYGPSETHVVTAFSLGKNPDEWSSHPPIGTPIANTQIYLVDTHFNPVPIGVPGELYIGGVSLARGYLNRPDLTAEKFIANPFSDQPGARLYKTGDLARYLPDGNIEYLGRIDHQVKIRGFRIELGEIEAVLSQHPAVGKVVVLAQEDIANHLRLVAYVVLDKQAAPTTSDLRRFLQQKLPEYMMPSAFVLLEALPLTSNGKVDRQALLTPNLNGSELNANFVAPRTAAEKIVADIWKQVLGINQVGIHDNFFELGGQSLLATQVFFKLRRIFQVELSLRHLFETPTVEGLVNVIEQNRGGREVVEKIAQTLIEVKQLSPEEVKKMLLK